MSSSAADLGGAIALREAGRYRDAAQALQILLADHPRDAAAHAVLAQVLSLDKQEGPAWAAMNTALSMGADLPVVQRNHARLLLRRQMLAEALRAAQAAYRIDAADPESQLVLAAALGANTDEALALIEAALRTRPDYAEAWANRAMFKMRANDFAGALADAEKALSIKPHLPQLWGVVGSLRLRARDLPGAVEALESALAQEPGNAGRMAALGNVKRLAGQVEAAIQLLERATSAAPGDAGTWVNLGAALQSAQQTSKAKAAYAKALEIAPDQAEALSNLGVLARQEGNWAEAERLALKALELKPEDVNLLNILAKSLFLQGNPVSGLDYSIRSLALEESYEAKTIFISCIKAVEFGQYDKYLSEIVRRALAEPWGRPGELTRPAANIVKLNPLVRECLARCAEPGPGRLSAQDLWGQAGVAALSEDLLFCTLLSSAPINDIQIERLLTVARRALLETVGGPEASSVAAEAALGLCCALAHQCFINEYVFAHGEGEIDQANALRASLIDALERGLSISPLRLVTAATYFPLHTLENAGRLLDMDWPQEVAAILQRRVREPAAEAGLRETIPRLGDIEDDVSRLVQQQYEDNPYPRWINLARNNTPIDVGSYLQRIFPRAELKPVVVADPEILIAGCGTGQHPIMTGQLFRGAKVCAVDLSLTSLSYAKRKTQEMALSSIEYMQADLLQLGRLGRTFEVIESAGVLHHLENPFAGWRVLKSLLRPHGLMGIGLYSEVARRHVVAARRIIADRGFAATADGIRRARQYLVGLDAATLGNVTKSGDFFSISGCRDLLFHVQEHRLTLPQIAAFLQEENLNLLGFSVDPSIVQAYVRRFPNDPAATDLAQWDMFEAEKPDIFFGMYQFWLQRND